MPDPTPSSIIALTINGRTVRVPTGTTILAAAREIGIDIPTLCYHPNLTANGVCRLCVVEVVGARTLQPACVTRAAQDMVVNTETDRVHTARRVILELLASTVDLSETPDVLAYIERYGARPERFGGGIRRECPVLDDNPFYIRDYSKCVMCWRCIQVCAEDVQNTYALTWGGRGIGSRVTTAFEDKMPDTTCVFCGNCVGVCPTGALKGKVEWQMGQMARANSRWQIITRHSSLVNPSTRTTCPYCGVGCQIDLRVKDDRIVRVDAPFEVAPNHGRLCVKGRFGLDFVHHPSRLTAPLIRRVPQTPGARTAATSPDEWREASWDEALDLVAARLLDLRRRYGPDSITANACAKATNEDNYLLQKYLRAVIGTNNIDHCARLCHAGSVAGLQLALGSSAMSNAIAEMPDLECFMVIGSNTAETHPVIATFLKQAVRKNGARLIVVDPRQTEMTRFAELWLREKPGTDTALFSAMAHVVVAEKLYDEAFVAARTEGFEEYAASLAEKTPEWAAAITGVPAEDIRRAARIYAGAQAAAMYWGMGISQSTHGTDNTLTLTNLALLCGHIGRPGTGLNPLRGQNNVQGCSDMGGVPSFYTAYQPVTDPTVRAAFEAAWGVPLPAEPGLTTTEMVDGILSGRVKGWYVMGENPLMSEPNLAHARHAVEQLEFLVGQDIFFNETNVYADVILPAASFAEKDGTFTNSDRRVQRVRQALPPPGQARADWEIVAELARRTIEDGGRKTKDEGPKTGNSMPVVRLPSFVMVLSRPKRHLGRDAPGDARLRRHQL